MVNPHQVTRDFEQALCTYTGSPFAVATTSCTMALLLALEWHNSEPRWESLREYPESVVKIPKHTYVSVPMSITHAGFYVEFEDRDWEGAYQLYPLPVYDYARWFTSGMFGMGDREAFLCVSFHWSKTLAIGQGGAILHNNVEADKWFRRMRFDGRTEGVAPKDEKDLLLGYHAYMSPRDAADGLSRLAVLPEHNNPLPNDDYPDLSKMEIFK